jgi:MEMO1 family protein
VGREVRLLVAPHIDIPRGAAAYAHAYGALAGCQADLFVVFGTAHATPPHLFTLTGQDYATPLGPVPTDRALVAALARELSEEEVLGDELAHRGEHSCEFQMVWLRWLLGDRPFQALPVLCSTISHLADPAAATAPFLDALARATAGRRVCFVAGADLAHVGPQYGDGRPATAAELARHGAHDRATLATLAAGDPDAFHRRAVVDDERRRLCGVAPIYAAARAAGRGARLLHYGQWSDGVDMVSFAAAAG